MSFIDFPMGKKIKSAILFLLKPYTCCTPMWLELLHAHERPRDQTQI